MEEFLVYTLEGTMKHFKLKLKIIKKYLNENKIEYILKYFYKDYFNDNKKGKYIFFEEEVIKLNKLIDNIKIKKVITDENINVMDGAIGTLSFINCDIKLELTWNMVTPSNWKGVNKLSEYLTRFVKELN